MIAMVEQTPIYEVEIRRYWGFDWFHTPWRWGLGFELNVGAGFVIGVRVGSLWCSWGRQIDFSPHVIGFTTLSGEVKEG